ncbi:hypothetical protein [uncultured Haemophilus sp.]|mgnify:FL=1|uniref:hypothetical protein n=1 Tax=uncultured Haemophilus sp. TaxID=237779 RepID=UPI00258B846E|nr:hypothetical protein [uncultured Haemophilus sp.]
MKLIKILPALAMTLAVSAYAKEMPKMEKASDTMATLPAIMDKTVVYTCNKKTVTAVYQFEDQEPSAAMLSVGNKIISKNFMRNKETTDFTQFVAGDYVWNVDSGLTLDNFDTVIPVNLIQKGKQNDTIIVKNCDINTEATAKANR